MQEPIAAMDPDEQLVALGDGGWAVPPIVAFGTEEQKQRVVVPTLRGEVVWCQLFSEPGAGSDLASLSTKAEKVEGRLADQRAGDRAVAADLLAWPSLD
jgi:alkylation response protein AidB-like acyl-CoA dehydrogenase